MYKIISNQSSKTSSSKDQASELSKVYTLVYHFVQKTLIRTNDSSSRCVFIFSEVRVIRKMREIVDEDMFFGWLSVNNVLAFWT